MRVERFQALASSYRLSILGMLRQGPMTAGDIARQFDISQPSISRHLEVLRHANMVTTEKKGTLVIYSLNLSAIQDVMMDVTELLAGTIKPSNIIDKKNEDGKDFKQKLAELEPLRTLAEADLDVAQGETAMMQSTFDDIRKKLLVREIALQTNKADEQL